MADIFISYSSKDREKADQLTELLTSAGLSVWIDQSALEVSTSWSSEIVDAINGCQAFIVLLSPNSIESHNVIKEVSLASEKRKKILPLELEPITLPRELEYQLAGIHRPSLTNLDSIIRALGKLGLKASQAPTLKIVKETDGRKSLMILPFEDLSPTADNQWFADGLATELISALSNVKSLKVTDQQTTKEFKNFKGQLATYAKEMSIRYFIQGSVRKFGDQIKITSSLLDIETGDHLWQDSLKGTMEDIFDIQEMVAEKVVEGLKVHLAPEEKQKLTKRGTENAEAYELWLKGGEYYKRHTKSDYERALSLFEESVRLDPNFAGAHAQIANTSQEIYRNYNRNPLLLDQAEESAERVRELEGETAQYAWVKSLISLNRGDLDLALRYAKRSIELDPNYAVGYDSLGFIYHFLGDKSGAVSARQEYIRLQENNKTAHFNLLVILNELPHTPENREELRSLAEQAVSIYERYVRLNPDDYSARVSFATVLQWASRSDESLQEADKLCLVESLDGAACYNLACVYLKASDTVKGLSMLRRSIGKGYQDIETFRRDPDLYPLRGMPEFEELMKELEEKIAIQKP
jgi:TolB-like protein/Flp pilus assembly protein TadD